MDQSSSPRAAVPYVRVTDARGATAMAEPIPSSRRGEGPRALIHLDDGRSVIVPGHQLTLQRDGSYAFAGQFDQAELAFAAPAAANDNTGDTASAVSHEAAPAEQTGPVRVHKRVLEDTVVLDEPREHVEVVVERVPVNQYVAAPVAVRYEGETMVVPVLEEVVVVERRLVLREEVRVTRRVVTDRERQAVPVRRETVELEPQRTPR